MGQNDPGADEHTGCDEFVDTLHADDDVLPVLDVVYPSGHAVQLVEPETLHEPFAQTTAVAFVEPAGHAYPGGHTPEHSEAVKPTVLP